MLNTSHPTLCARLSTVALAVALSVALLPAAEAVAQDLTGAARAYARGQTAERNGDHSRAAELYETAYALAPAPEALRSAVRMRRTSGQMSSAATLASQLRERYPDDATSRALANEVLEQATPTLLRIHVSCSPGCTLALDGFAAALVSGERHVVFSRPGGHNITATFPGGASASERVDGVAGESRELTLNEPAPSVTELPADPFASSGGPPPEEGGGGITPIVFAAGLVLTAGLGALTVWSGVDTLSARNAYDGMMTRERYDDGLGRELRTNVFVVATAGFGVATVVIALFTDWGGGDASEDQAIAPLPPVMIGATPESVHVIARGAF